MSFIVLIQALICAIICKRCKFCKGVACMVFKDKVLYVRAKLNLSQTELAEKLKVSFTTVSRWENGKVEPTRKAHLMFEQFCAENYIEFEDKQ